MPTDDLALDFANRWRDRGGGEPDRSYSDLVGWAEDADLIDPGGGAALRHRAEAQPALAQEVVATAHRLGTSIHGVFAAVAAGRDPADEHVNGLNHALAEAMPHLRLRRGAQCCTWTWSGPDEALDRLLWPVARAAADLLTSDRLDRVRECASATCRWLFMDTSRNRSRRWCDMAVCGNRAKARRYYSRHR
jgi:predicted RNA-binding Zn ribbon-like protein